MVAILCILFLSGFANLVTAEKQVNSRCLLISKSVFSRSSDSDFDSLLSSTKSIIFEFYSNLYKSDFEAIYNAKSRHFMILKILTSQLNLSINACGEDQYPTDENKLDINFAMMPYDHQLNQVSKTELIHSREDYVVKFASVKSPDVSSLFLSLVKPIGIALFLASCCLTVVLILAIWLLDNISKLISVPRRTTSVSVLAALFGQALIGQCVSYRRTVELFKCNITLRLAYLAWLLYCILITSGYNGNLLQELMQPAETLSSQTFDDLLADPRPVVGFWESRLGQVPDILKCLDREAKERFETFGKLLQKFDSKSGVSYPEHILDGKVNVMGDEEVLRAQWRDAMVSPTTALVELGLLILFFGV